MSFLYVEILCVYEYPQKLASSVQPSNVSPYWYDMISDGSESAKEDHFEGCITSEFLLPKLEECKHIEVFKFKCDCNGQFIERFFMNTSMKWTARRIVEKIIEIVSLRTWRQDINRWWEHRTTSGTVLVFRLITLPYTYWSCDNTFYVCMIII